MFAPGTEAVHNVGSFRAPDPGSLGRKGAMTGPGAFSIETFASHEGHLVAMYGEVDLACESELLAALNVIDDSSNIALDLSRVEFMDARGLRVMLIKAGAMRVAGGSLRISAASSHVRRLLHMTHLTSLLERPAERVHPADDTYAR
jgi:anti-sigma B factor antagonist